jgi:hypothetical protein
MAVKVFCPHCDASRMVSEDRLGREVPCRECGKRYVPGGGRHDERDADEDEEEDDRPRRRRSRDDDEDRPRRRRPSRTVIQERLGTPSVFLMVVAILQACIHAVGFFGMAAQQLMNQNNDPPPEVALLICAICAIGFLKDFFVIRGALAMRRGDGYHWAKAGAIMGCLPDAGCLFGFIAGVWCLVGLSDSQVRAAFSHSDYEEQDDDF